MVGMGDLRDFVLSRVGSLVEANYTGDIYIRASEVTNAAGDVVLPYTDSLGLDVSDCLNSDE